MKSQVFGGAIFCQLSQCIKGWQRKRPITRKRKMKKTITVILAIALMAIPTSAMAHIESWAEYDQRLEKQIADAKAKLPIGGKEEDDDIPFDMKITSIEKNGKAIITTLETKGEFGWIAMAEKMGGVEKFKAMMQRKWAGEALMTSGLQLARRYTLRYRFVDNGKEVCTVDVSAMIIRVMISRYGGLDDLPEYVPEPLPLELINKFNEYEKYKKEGGYPPALTTEELHLIREYGKYKKY
jgi:hypothetical protein